MSEELEVLTIVAERLGRCGIPYMVTGSMALNYYAVPRMTRDVDLVVELSQGDADRVCDLFGGDFYVDRETVRESIERREAFNLIHTALVIKVDFVVRKDSDYRRTEFSRRRRASFEGHPLFVVAPEDLVISKLDWARDSRSDTSPEMEARYHAMLLARSGEERLRMAGQMYATARALVVASILELNPRATPAEIRQALFLRFYGHEFDAETRGRILARLAKSRGDL